VVLYFVESLQELLSLKMFSTSVTGHLGDQEKSIFLAQNWQKLSHRRYEIELAVK
jgi:hypothetical protein